MNTMTFQERQDLDAEIAKVHARVGEAARKLQDLRESDDPKIRNSSKWTEALNDYTVDSAMYNYLLNTRRDLPPAESMGNEHVKRAQLEADPVARFIIAAEKTGDGFQGLESDEIASSREMHEQQVSRNGGVGSAKDLVVSFKDFVKVNGGSGHSLPQAAFDSTDAASTIPTTTVARVAEVLQDSTGVLAASQVLITEDGAPMRFPTSDQTAEVGARLSAENTQIADGELAAFGHKEIGAETYTSSRIPLTKEAISDSNVPLIQYAIQRATRRLVRIWGQDATLGSGATGIPRGIVPSAGTGVTMKTGTGAQNLSIDDLYSIYFSIEQAYLDGAEGIDGGARGLSGGRVGFMMSRAVYSVLVALRDNDGRPLFMPGQTSLGQSVMPMQVFGLPVFINYWMDSNLTVGAKKSILFGNFSEHLIRIADGLRISVYDDGSTAIRNAVDVYGFGRMSAEMIGPGTTSNSFKVLASKS